MRAPDPAVVLSAAADIVAQPDGWTQGSFARTSAVRATRSTRGIAGVRKGEFCGTTCSWCHPYASCWCIGGAINLAAHRAYGFGPGGIGFDEGTAARALALVATRWMNGVHGLKRTADLNDAPGMDQARAAQALRTAAAAWTLAHPPTAGDRLADAVEAFKRAVLDALPARIRRVFT